MLEIWLVESGIQFKDSGIPLVIGIRNLETGIQILLTYNPESNTWNLESTA